MEFSSVWYFSFCSIINLVFLIIGLHGLDKAALPVPDGFVFLFKVLLFFSMCTLSSYAFLFRPPWEHAKLNKGSIFGNFYLDLCTFLSPAIFHVPRLLEISNQSSPWTVVFAVLDSVGCICLLVCAFLLMSIRFSDSKATGIRFLTGYFGPLIIYPSHTLCWILFNNLYFLVRPTKFCLGKYSGFLVLLHHWLFSLICLNVLSMYQTLLRPRFKTLLAASDFMAYVYRKRKNIETIVGLSGILVDEYITRKINSVDLVFALLCFGVSWLAILAMNQPNTDFGVFYFLIFTSVKGAVNVFGLHGYTCLVLGIGILLFIARWNIDSISVQYTGMQEVVMREWKSLEQLRDSELPR